MLVKLLPFLTCLTIINAYNYKYKCDIENSSRHNLEGLETLAEKDEIMVTIKSCSGVITDKTFKGFPQLSWLIIERSNIEEINTTLPIISLRVEDSNFPNLDKDLQQKMPNIRYLWLLNNKDFEVDPHILKKIKNLTLLWSNNTNIIKDCVTKEWFQGLDLLQELKLRDSNLTCISKDAFNSLKNLRLLDLSYNRISNFQRETFEKLTKLNSLSISVNDIENIDLNIFVNQKNSLEVLSISWNALKQSKISAQELLEAFPKLKWLIIEDKEMYNDLKAKEFCQTMFQHGLACNIFSP